MKVSTHLDYTNYNLYSTGSELVTKNGGMLLPTSWNDINGVTLKNKGDVYLQFYCHIKSKYGLDEIRNSMLDYTEFVNKEKKLIYKVDVYELTYFLNGLYSPDLCDCQPTITYSTGNGYVQWFKKPIELMVDKWIKKNIINKK